MTTITRRPLLRSRGARIAAVLATALLYAAVVLVVQPATTLPGNVAPIFPAAGLALAAVLLLGWPALPAVWLGSFTASAATYGPSLTGAVIATGAMVSAGGGAWLGTRLFRGEPPLQSARNSLLLVTAVALGAAAVSASAGTLTLAAAGITPWAIAGYAWLTWLLGDAFGIVIAAPLVLAWAGEAPRRAGPRRGLEGLALAALTLALCRQVFFRGVPLEYGLLPLLAWAAFRFSMRGTTAVATTIAFLATIGTSLGSSPFARGNPNDSLLALHSFLGVSVIFALLLAGVLVERQRMGQSQARLAIAVEQAGDAIAIVDHRGAILYANAAFEAQSGLPRADALGKTVAELGVLRPDDTEHLWRRLEATGSVEGVELEVLRRDGERATVQLSARRARNGGAPVTVLIARDVTHERRLAAAVRHAQRFETMGALAAGIAHNFRNALTAVVPNIAFALDEAPPSLRPPLEDALKAAAAAVELADDLTRMSRGEAAAPQEEFDVGGVVRDVAAICRTTFGSRLRFDDDLGDGLGRLRGRAGQLQQALLNLCLNARDALEGVAAPRIALSARRVAEGGQVEIVVADNGCGMSPEALRRVGEPFFTTKPEGKGTGLGLSTAFAAVRDAGGRLGVESRPGAGTTFRLLLPVLEAGAGPAASAGGRPIPRLGGRVVVVDDDATALEALARQLASLGMEAERFDDPRAALERLARAPGEVQVLITDLRMPGMGGVELAERARSIAPGLSLVVVSGTPDPVLPHRTDAVLLKPVATPDLAAALERCLRLQERGG